MQFDQILVIAETRRNEKRVAITPNAALTLGSKGYCIWVEENAGLNAGFSNKNYRDAGAKIVSLSSSGYPANTFIVRVLWDNEKGVIENKYFHKNTAILGFLFSFLEGDHITRWQESGLTTLSLDLFKSLAIDDTKNAQAAMSRIAGRLAFQAALNYYQGEKALKLTVIGAGAAGLSAAFEARKYDIPVQVFGRKALLRSRLEEQGIAYYILPNENQINFIKDYLNEATIIITAARTPGKKAPVLIDEQCLSILSSHAVVIDLAVSNGGNVIGSKHDQIINLQNNVSIINVSNYLKLEPKASSEIYAQCVVNLLTEITSPAGEVVFENELVQEIWLTRRGGRRSSLYDNFNNSIIRKKANNKI